MSSPELDQEPLDSDALSAGPVARPVHLTPARFGGRLPWGTITINVTGSFQLGSIAGLAQAGPLPEAREAVLGTGLLGGCTTFSTAGVETVRLLQERRALAAVLNGVGMLVVAVAAAVGGHALGVAL